jgi:hypothetical protein
LKRINLHLLGYIILITGIIIFLNFSGCGSSHKSKPTPSTQTVTPVGTPTPGVTPPTPTSVPTATATATPTPTPTSTPTPVPTSTPTPVPTVTPMCTVTPALTFTPTPVPILNLVSDPGFETGGYWNYVNSFNDFANAYRGFYCLKYPLGAGYCTQNIDTGFTPGEIIRARCWVKGDTSGNIFNLVLQFFKPGGGANGVQSINAIISKTYTKVERTGITIPANTACITVLISGSGGGFGIVDNVYVGP